MDYLPHPFLGQSQTTHQQPHFHRCAWASTLRPQGRLPRRIFRRRSSHRASADLRGHLCPPARGRNSRANCNSTTARVFTVTRNPTPPDCRDLLSSSSQTPSTRPQCLAQPALFLRLRRARFPWRGSNLRTVPKPRNQTRAAFNSYSPAGFNRPTAFEWRSASSRAIKVSLSIWAFATGVAATLRIISFKSTFTSGSSAQISQRAFPTPARFVNTR